MADFRGYMIGSFASSRLDRGGIPVVATTGKVSDASAAEPTVDFGINPCQWNSLPPEGILLWKVRHPVTETEASYPATIVLPSGLSTTTPVTVSNAGVIVNKTPMGFLFARNFIMITFVRGRSFCHGRVGGNEKGHPHGHPFPLVENYLKTL